MGEMGKDFCINFLQPFLESIDRRSCNDGSRKPIPVFHNPHRKGRPSPAAVARTLEYLVGVPSWAASSGRAKNQVRINTQKTREYLEGSNQASYPIKGVNFVPIFFISVTCPINCHMGTLSYQYLNAVKAIIHSQRSALENAS